MKDECYHARYSKEELEQRWLGHATCIVRVRRKCLECGYIQDDWEWGNNEGHPRMFPDEINFFAGDKGSPCEHENIAKKSTGRFDISHDARMPGESGTEYQYRCLDCGRVWNQWG